ncbi:MAG: polysaccharide deacetylase family protein [Xanthobacteraceae bacterium]
MIDLRALGAAVVLLALTATGAALAAECPGKPDALGTSRTLVIDPNEHVRLGMMQYPETLPLADHEVVLTFDDGPLPPYSSRILDLLNSECVKATYFLVGRMAKAYPDMVQKIHAAGHTVGTHSNSHPFTFHRMSAQQADAEVEGGIASVAAALGDRNAVAPFFRIPGLARSDTVERYLAGRSLMTWSADFPVDDWRHISAAEIVKRAFQRLEARGRGMMLLHDIQPATALAMPTILKELKRRGYRIVHVVPAAPDRVKTATLSSDWLVRKSGKNRKNHKDRKDGEDRKWPKPELSIAVLAADSVLPAPAPANLGLAEPFSPDEAVDLPRLHFFAVAQGETPLPPESPWSQLRANDKPVAPLASADSAELPAPGVSSFGYGDDFVPTLPKANSLKRHASSPPARSKNTQRASAHDVTSSVHVVVIPDEKLRPRILHFLFPARPARPM